MRFAWSLERDTHLFDDHAIDVRVEGQHEQRRRDDCGEIEKDQIVVVHHLDEEALLMLRLGCMPAEQRQEAHNGPGDPTH